MTKKAVFFDIDGTLVPYRSPIPDSTVEAIRLLRENGHLAVVSTGRTLPLIMKEVFDLGFDGIVAGCGAYVEYDGDVVYSEIADKERTEALAQALIEDNLIPFYESWQGIYYFPDIMTEEVMGAAQYYKTILGDKFMPVRDDMELNKIYTPLNGREFDLSGYKSFEDYFDIHVHGNVAIEAVPKIYNKATGMEKFLQAAGIDRADTFAIGDSLNDAEMLVYANTGIVMGGAFDEAKKYADYITTNIEDDGIYNALKHFGLI